MSWEVNARGCKTIATGVSDLSAVAASPKRHFQAAISAAYNAANYFDGVIERTPETRSAISSGHLRTVRTQALLGFVSAFERYLKEVAAVCVDVMSPLVIDDRFDVFAFKGAAAAGHFEASTLGAALCEGSTWLDIKDVNKRFRRLLAKPGTDGQFHLLGKSATDATDSPRREQSTIDFLFQVRHTIAHNCGLLTRSDAASLSKHHPQPLEAPGYLEPQTRHLIYARYFLQPLVTDCDDAVFKELNRCLRWHLAENPAAQFDADKAKARVKSAFLQIATF